jgi:hypothetical protein
LKLADVNTKLFWLLRGIGRDVGPEMAAQPVEKIDFAPGNGASKKRRMRIETVWAPPQELQILAPNALK